MIGFCKKVYPALNWVFKRIAPFLKRHIRGYQVCDGGCFLPARTMIYLPDGANLATPVLFCCPVHSGTWERELYVGCHE